MIWFDFRILYHTIPLIMFKCVKLFFGYHNHVRSLNSTIYVYKSLIKPQNQQGGTDPKSFAPLCCLQLVLVQKDFSEFSKVDQRVGLPIDFPFLYENFVRTIIILKNISENF